jgi:hypothetical protein
MSSSDTIEPALSVGAHPGALERAAPAVARARWSQLWTLASIGLGVCLLSPALGTGLVADDYLHQLMLREDPGIDGLRHRPLDLFRFADGSPHTAQALMNEGVFPWWADRGVLLAFFRPLSSLTHWLDYRLWPERPELMHLHSLAWFALTIAIVAAVYRRLGAGGTGFCLATLLFAIDDAHAPIVGWIANRNALVALCLALPALIAHDRLRREGFAPGLWLGPLLFTLGLCAGEVALAVVPYLLAYAACLDRGRRRLRYGALLPYLIVAGVWKLCCDRFGYGALGSGLYVDPLREPLAFISAGCERLPVLGLGLLAAPFAELWELYPLFSTWARLAVLLAALLVLTSFAVALRPLIAHDPRLRFWTTGTALSLVPMCATFPHDRLLLAPSIGGMAVIAALISAGWARRKRLVPAPGALALIALHLIAAPVLAPLRAASVGHFDELLRASDATLPAGPELATQTLILINPPLDPFAAYLPAYRQALRRPRARQQLWLATGVSDVRIATLDAHTLSVRQQDGFIGTSMQRMLRSVGPQLEREGSVQLEGVEIRVTERTNDHRPLEIHVRFERALTDPSLIWRRWLGRGYAPFGVPAQGHAVVLPKAALGALLFES